MGISFRDCAKAAVVAKDGAKAGRGQGFSPVRAFKDDKKERSIGLGPLYAEVAVKNSDGLRIKRQESLPITFSLNADLGLGQTKVFELEVERLAGAQTVKKHQGDQAQIAIGAKAAPELSDFGDRQWNHNPARDFDSKCAPKPPGACMAKAGGSCVSCFGAVACRGNLGAMVKAVQTVRHANAMVDGLSGGLWLMVHLETEVVDQARQVELG